ncbi:probable maltase-glucoamylase 2 [Watersipora subatra]|uniref:probable maltase-glucoamylase 2 n=1 Tax=Watersipora subatra TaxID=2589382 RepID=UPI00355B914B
MLTQILLAATLISTAAAFSSGAPGDACMSRIPLHGVSAQTSQCPFDFVALGWVPGEYTSMGIFPTEVDSNLEFKGFLASVFYNDEPIGEMRKGRSSDNIPTDAGVQTACEGTSLTHSDSGNKKEIFFEWKAPLDLPETAEVTLRLTIVETRTQFWVDCGLVQLGSLSSNPVSTTTFPTTSSSSSTSTTTPLPRTNPPTTTQRPRTNPPTTTRRPRTRPPTTTPPFTTSTTSATTSSTSSTLQPATARQTRPRTTARPVRTRPQTTARPVRTRPQTTARPVRTRPQTTARPVRTRPQTTARPVRTRPQTTSRPIRTRPQTTARPVRTRPQTTSRPVRTRPQTTARPIRTRPRTTSRPVRTRPHTMDQRPVTTRRPVPVPPSHNDGTDSYLNYQHQGYLKHETMSGQECVEYGNVYRIIPNTRCREFTQSIYGSITNTNPIKCPGDTRFDPRVCSCAFTTYCYES